MVQQIINDAKDRETETIRLEEDAQKAYEDCAKEKRKDIIYKFETKARQRRTLSRGLCRDARPRCVQSCSIEKEVLCRAARPHASRAAT